MDTTEGRDVIEHNVCRQAILSEHSRDILLFMRRDDGRILEANAAAVNTYGYSREELLSRTIHDLRAPGTQAQTTDQMAQADDAGLLFETVHQRKDGSTFPVEVSSQGATIGETRTLISVIRDITERRQAEEAWRASEARFRTLAEAAFEGVCISEDARIRDCNDQFARMLGYERGELLDRWVGDLVSPEFREQVIRNIHQGREVSIEHEMLHKDGSRRIVEAHGRTVLDGGRRIRITTARDITERKRAEEALRRSEQQFKSTFENAAVGIAHVELDGRFLRYNDRFSEIVGHPYDGLAGTTCPEITRRDDWEMERVQVRQLIEDQIDHYTMEKRYVRHDGGLSWVSLTRSLQRDEAGRPEYFIVIVQDISRRKALEEQLRQLNQSLEEEVRVRTEQLAASVDRLHDEVGRRVAAEGRLRKRSQMLEAFFQHTITPLAFLDWSFSILRVNEAYAKAGGKEPEYFVGKNHFDLYPDEESRTLFERVVQTKQPHRAYAKSLAYGNGSKQGKTWWNWQLTPLLDEHGGVQFLVLNLEDVTEQQKAVQELEQRARQLQQLTMELSQAEDRERRRLAQILHDDLQQMLAAAKFHLGMLKNRARGDESLQDLASQVDKMLREAIDKSRSLSHELSPAVLYRSDLGETFEWLAGQMQAKHGLTIHVEVRGQVDSPSEGLKVFLYKAAQEILFNVVKHARVREAHLRIQRVRGQLWLTIGDRGLGFDPTAIGQTGGFGLLSIRERVGLLGGRMKIRSAVGRGSTFLIALPDGEPVPAEFVEELQERAEPTERRAPVQETDYRLRVLLVDDHKIVREGLESMLRAEQDIEVVGQAGNGREAVEQAQRLQPDVVVMDVAMPVMGGDEATRQIKHDQPQMRVIALSMFDDPRIADRMRRAGAAAYLLKTAPAEELLGAIRGTQLAQTA